MKHRPFERSAERTRSSRFTRSLQPCGRTLHAASSMFVVAMLLLTSGLEAKEIATGTPAAPTPAHMGLTPAYLAGEWCFTHVQFPKERAEENIRYRFDSDTTFATQNTSGSDMRPGFKYSYKPDGAIKLATFAGFLQVKSVQPEAFVLRMSGDLHFRRGACP